jgi:hypothetical protein
LGLLASPSVVPPAFESKLPSPSRHEYLCLLVASGGRGTT